MSWTQRFCDTCGIVTRHDAGGTCQDFDVNHIPLAPIEDGRRDRPVIVLRKSQ